jgi:hypothetical protein
MFVLGTLIDNFKQKKDNKIDNDSLINKILDVFKKSKVLFIILTLFGGVFGQLVARIFLLDGSIDKWYLLIPPLSVYPLSLYPAYLLYYNKIKRGEDGSPFDNSVIIPALISGIILLLVDNTNFLKGTGGAIIKFIVNVLCISYALYKRDDRTCGMKTPNIDKIIIHSIVLVSLVPLINILLSYVPYYNKITDKIAELSDNSQKVVTVFIQFITIIVIYIFYNMYTGLNPKSSCEKNYKGKHHELILYIIAGLIINIIIGNGKSNLAISVSDD